MSILQIWRNVYSRLFPRKNKSASFLEKLIGYQPGNVNLYKQALTHRSNNHHSNERLEYLGDAVISLVIAHRLYNLFPTKGEGFLTRARAKVVCREHLNQVAKTLKLNQHIITGTPIKYNSENIFGNALEALVGAIYLDKGYQQAERFVEKNIIGKNNHMLLKLATKEVDFKSRLLEYAQAKHLNIQFNLLAETYNIQKDQHTFIYQVILNNQSIAQAAGHNKLEAQQTAAHKALQSLKIIKQ